MNNTHTFRYLPDNDGRIFETEKKNRYRFGVFQNGGRCILFPEYCEFDKTVQWYAPTEKQIYATSDDEIILMYKKIDQDNLIQKPERYEYFYENRVVKTVDWKSRTESYQ
jgi:hypothetical protein